MFYLPFQGSKAVIHLCFIFIIIYVSFLLLLCCLVCSLHPCDYLLGKDCLFTLLCVMFSCVFVTYPYGVPEQVWYLIMSIPDLCLLLYFPSGLIQDDPLYVLMYHRVFTCNKNMQQNTAVNHYPKHLS